MNRPPLILDTAYFVCITLAVFAERFPIGVLIAGFRLAIGIKRIDLSRPSTLGVFLMLVLTHANCYGRSRRLGRAVDFIRITVSVLAAGLPVGISVA